MRKQSQKIKVSSCISLVKAKKMYLEVALHCLQEELSKEKLRKELVYCLCDYITAINKVISYFTALIDKAEGDSFEIVYAQAIVAKSYVVNFKLLKQILMQDYNILVEVN